MCVRTHMHRSLGKEGRRSRYGVRLACVGTCSAGPVPASWQDEATGPACPSEGSCLFAHPVDLRLHRPPPCQLRRNKAALPASLDRSPRSAEPEATGNCPRGWRETLRVLGTGRAPLHCCCAHGGLLGFSFSPGRAVSVFLFQRHLGWC